MKETITKLFEGKEIRKENLRDNMTDIEVIITDLGEVATRELAKKHKPRELQENKSIAKKGRKVTRDARKSLENKLGESVVIKNNILNYQYKDNKLLK